MTGQESVGPRDRRSGPSRPAQGLRPIVRFRGDIKAWIPPVLARSSTSRGGCSRRPTRPGRPPGPGRAPPGWALGRAVPDEARGVPAQSRARQVSSSPRSAVATMTSATAPRRYRHIALTTPCDRAGASAPGPSTRSRASDALVPPQAALRAGIGSPASTCKLMRFVDQKANKIDA
jgi:hypothetical protein